uniref:RNA polymerase III subunit G n=1 Tax=Equus asinus TaxID=9793 RepID=A0A8C4ML44_EQUAS
MAGNKGRGRAAYTFNIEAVGFSRGEKLPDVVLKPPPLFPDTDYKPVPLRTGEGEDYMLALKQELRETMKRMPYFMETPEEKQEIFQRKKRIYFKKENPYYLSITISPIGPFYKSKIHFGILVILFFLHLETFCCFIMRDIIS